MTFEQISAATGVPVPILAAIAKIESNGNVRAVRFEERLFRERGGNVAGITGTGRSAVTEALRRNLPAAVESTSWGRFQVLGGHGARLYSGQHRRFVEAFETSPGHVGDLIAIEWWRANPRARAAAAAGDLSELGRRYNGSPDPDGAGPLVSRWVARLEREIAKGASVPASSSGRAGVAAVAALVIAAAVLR